MSYQRNYSMGKGSIEKTLKKDMRFKKVTGVCAGIAKHYQLPRLGVRIGAIAALFMFPMVTGVAYVVATVVLPNKY